MNQQAASATREARVGRCWTLRGKARAGRVARHATKPATPEFSSDTFRWVGGVRRVAEPAPEAPAKAGHSPWELQVHTGVACERILGKAWTRHDPPDRESSGGTAGSGSSTPEEGLV